MFGVACRSGLFGSDVYVCLVLLLFVFVMFWCVLLWFAFVVYCVALI